MEDGDLYMPQKMNNHILLKVMPKVSIIVPVHNTEIYLEKCIASLINQTMQDIEIILIDDASTDSSKLIMQHFEKMYPDKIICIYLFDNIFQGGARNRGIEIAKGEFIMFVDSDDFVDEGMCEKLYIKAKETLSDIVFCDILKIYEEKNKKMWFSYVFDQQLDEMTDESRKMYLFTEGYPVAKIIKKKLIDENQIRYPEKVKYEDLAKGSIFYIYAHKTDYVREPLYYYNIRKNSTSQKVNSVEHYDFVIASKLLCNYLESISEKFNFTEEIEALFTYGILQGIKKVLTQFDYPNIEIIYIWYLELIERYPKYIDNKYYYYKNEPIGMLALEYASKSKEELLAAYKQGKLKESYASYNSYYNKFRNTIMELFEDCKRKKWRIAIWGAGKKGSDFLQECDPKREHIFCVIDKDPYKIGKYTQTGHAICTLEDVKHEVNVIISMNRFYHTGIKTEVKKINNKIFVINLDVYLILCNRIAFDKFYE